MTRMKKRKKKRLKLSHIVLLFILIYISLIFNNQRKLRINLEAKRDSVQLEVDQLQMEIEELESEIENSHTLQFVEKVAREELGLVKPREIIYIDKNKEKNPFLRIIKGDN